MPEVVQYGAKVSGVSVDEIRPRLVLWRVQRRERGCVTGKKRGLKTTNERASL